MTDREQLDTILLAERPADALESARLSGALQLLIPEMEQTYEMEQNHYHFGTVYAHTLRVVELLDSCDLTLRLAALLHDIGKIRTRTVTPEGKVHFILHEEASAQLCGIILRRLDYPEETIRDVKFLVRYHMLTKQWKDDLSCMKPKHLRKLQFICRTEERFRCLLLLIDADNKAHAPEYCMPNQAALIQERSKALQSEGTALFGFRLPLSREDIMQRKHCSNKEAKEVEDYLLKLAFVDPLRNAADFEKQTVGYKLRKTDGSKR